MYCIVTLVSVSKTIDHCFVLQMGRKAVGPMCCVTNVKETGALIRKENGFAPVFLSVAALCATSPCKPLVLNIWVSEFITAKPFFLKVCIYMYSFAHGLTCTYIATTSVIIPNPNILTLQSVVLVFLSSETDNAKSEGE